MHLSLVFSAPLGVLHPRPTAASGSCSGTATAVSPRAARRVPLVAEILLPPGTTVTATQQNLENPKGEGREGNLLLLIHGQIHRLCDVAARRSRNCGVVKVVPRRQSKHVMRVGCGRRLSPQFDLEGDAHLWLEGEFCCVNAVRPSFPAAGERRRQAGIQSR